MAPQPIVSPPRKRKLLARHQCERCGGLIAKVHTTTHQRSFKCLATWAARIHVALPEQTVRALVATFPPQHYQRWLDKLAANAQLADAVAMIWETKPDEQRVSLLLEGATARRKRLAADKAYQRERVARSALRSAEKQLKSITAHRDKLAAQVAYYDRKKKGGADEEAEL